ncbi:MAG: DUF4272 domain-containing protein [Anaerolineae bacterium]|nr:DUF4272 domain-containing protein [Anaerolineae bacterium]
MTANVTIYSAIDEIIPVKTLQNFVGDGQIQTDKSFLGRAPSRIQIRWPDLSITFNLMNKADLPGHLNGLAGYVAQMLGDSTTPPAKTLLQHILHTQQVFGTVIEPGWDSIGHGKDVILGVTAFQKGFFFAANALYNGQGGLIIGPPDARRHFFPDKARPTPANLARKARSESLLQQEGVPVSRTLPPVHDESIIQLRSRDEIVRRAICLCLMAILGESGSQDTFQRVMHIYGIEEDFTPAERAFAAYPNPDERMRAQFTWRYESYWVLLWALGFVEKLDRPDHLVDVHKAVTILMDHTHEDLMRQAQVRPIAEILDQLDLVYRYHWAVVEARLKQGPPPARLEPGVVYERHYALNWLVQLGHDDWDNVQTDT